MDQDTAIVNIHILGKEYRIACPKEEEQALMAAAYYLDNQMREVRDQGKVIGMERIAIMAALNIAYEMLHNKRKEEQQARLLDQHIRSLEARIEQALHKGGALQASSAVSEADRESS